MGKLQKPMIFESNVSTDPLERTVQLGNNLLPAATLIRSRRMGHIVQILNLGRPRSSRPGGCEVIEVPVRRQ